MPTELDRFIDIVATLRGPNGCPWDKEQTNKSILSCLLDEAYEYFEAVEENDKHKMQEELGDILLQVVLHSQIAKDEGRFDIEDVAREINEKLIRRHPHVFGDTTVAGSGEVIKNWEEIKRGEKSKQDRKYLVDGIPQALPALFRAEKVQRRVAKVGFDWDDMGPVLDKVEEEFAEFREAVEKGDIHHAEEELGDIFFALVNVARHKKICAEDALRLTVKKFIRRFRYIEDNYAASHRDIQEASLKELDEFWERSKRAVG
ncbi:MAG: nucleoside triphosphate pyrophosphohydrolase [Chitinivibrionales bacterium]|nr:nucleoside triphosphate pyrophosphohydrolase [Chitinivibrionales bacterium]